MSENSSITSPVGSQSPSRPWCAPPRRQSEAVEEPASARKRLGKQGQSENRLTHSDRYKALPRSDKACPKRLMVTSLCLPDFPLGDLPS